MGINEAVARKVLETVDCGLVRGLGKPIPGQMCVEAAVNYALGLPHGDNPVCVARSVRAFKIHLNDGGGWTSDAARAKGMRRLALVQLGTRDAIDERAFVKGLAELAEKWAPGTYWADAAAAAADAYAAAARNKVLFAVAEDVVQLLVRLNSPGAQWLYLTEDR